MSLAADIEQIRKMVRESLITPDKAKELIMHMLEPPRLVVSGPPSKEMLDAEVYSKQMLQDITAIRPDLSPHKRWHITPDTLQVSRPTREVEWNLYDKLKMRLCLKRGDTFGFDFLHIFNSGRKIFVFVVHNDEAAWIEDDNPTLFPSDTFLAKYYLVHDNLIPKG